MVRKSVAKVICLIFAFGINCSAIGSAAEQWSQPTQTEQWSQPTQTEQWSQPTQTEQWSQPTQTEQWSQPTQTEQWSQPTQTGQWPAKGTTQPAQTTQQSSIGPTVAPTDTALDFEKLYGTWHIWTTGGATNLYDKTGNYVTHEYTPGAEQGMVVINKDGTYKMSHAVWSKGSLVEGKWRLSFPGEINGLRIIAIVLLNGANSDNWAVSYSGDGKATLMSALEMQNGTALWIGSSELYRK